MDDGVDVSRGFVRNGMREGEAAAASASIMEEEWWYDVACDRRSVVFIHV